jgi:hypothetical protein
VVISDGIGITCSNVSVISVETTNYCCSTAYRIFRCVKLLVKLTNIIIQENSMVALKLLHADRSKYGHGEVNMPNFTSFYFECSRMKVNVRQRLNINKAMAVAARLNRF